MREFLRDQIWQFVGSVIALIALLVSVYIFIVQKKKKSLRYQVLTETDLLTINEEIKGKIKILFEDSPIQNVTLIVLNIINDGNIPIASSDFERPLSFSFGPVSHILSAEITKLVPKTLQPHLEVRSNEIKLSPMLLNNKDSITIKLLVEQHSNRIESDARIIGVTEVREIRNNPKETRDIIIAILIANIISLILIIVYNPSLIVILSINLASYVGLLVLLKYMLGSLRK